MVWFYWDNEYRIAGNFRGVQFSCFSRISGYLRKIDSQNKNNRTVYNGHDRTRPWKLNRENFEDCPSAKIGPHENFPLYGMYILLNLVLCVLTSMGTKVALSPISLATFSPLLTWRSPTITRAPCKDTQHHSKIRMHVIKVIEGLSVLFCSQYNLHPLPNTHTQ
jgi:hypothetical protein